MSVIVDVTYLFSRTWRERGGGGILPCPGFFLGPDGPIVRRGRVIARKRLRRFFGCLFAAPIQGAGCGFAWFPGVPFAPPWAIFMRSLRDLKSILAERI